MIYSDMHVLSTLILVPILATMITSSLHQTDRQTRHCRKKNRYSRPSTM